VCELSQHAFALGRYLAFHRGGSANTKDRATRRQFLKLRNPVELGQALQFALLLVLIILASHAIRDWLGEAGIYLLAAISGLADVDAITISMARLRIGEISMHSAALAVLAATVVNTLTKATLGAIIAGSKTAAQILGSIVGCVLIGVAVAWWWLY
jgi:uncharacterized membrane protein (DUF4010 family)